MTDTWEGLWANPLYTNLGEYPPKSATLIVDRIWLKKMKAVGDILHEKAAHVDSVKEYVMMEAENIKSDMDHKGMLKPALEHFLKE